MKTKNFKFTEDEIEIIKEVMADKGIKSEVGAIRFLLESYKEGKEDKNQKNSLVDLITENVLRAVDEKYKNLFTRLRFASKTSEENSVLLLDVANTFLQYHPEITDCVSVDRYVSPIIDESRIAYRRKIERAKQVKDNK